MKDFKNKILDYNYVKFCEPQVWGKRELSFKLPTDRAQRGFHPPLKLRYIKSMLSYGMVVKNY